MSTTKVEAAVVQPTYEVAWLEETENTGLPHHGGELQPGVGHLFLPAAGRSVLT
ncbi:hypothetical protein GCM10010377_68060 [Streptomyces viridiviolaceus]|nr:hypothetical protein GCM10010377_68060 [Streptomyces viridiviolaceus]